jgi:hypothetical protein
MVGGLKLWALTVVVHSGKLGAFGRWMSLPNRQDFRHANYWNLPYTNERTNEQSFTLLHDAAFSRCGAFPAAVFSMMVTWEPPPTSFAALTAINTAPMEAFWNELTQDEPKTSSNTSRNDATDIYHLTRVRFRCTSLALEMPSEVIRHLPEINQLPPSC